MGKISWYKLYARSKAGYDVFLSSYKSLAAAKCNKYTKEYSELEFFIIPYSCCYVIPDVPKYERVNGIWRKYVNEKH